MYLHLRAAPAPVLKLGYQIQQLTMTPERWRQVEEIFQSALDRHPQARAADQVEAGATDVTL